MKEEACAKPLSGAEKPFICIARSETANGFASPRINGIDALSLRIFAHFTRCAALKALMPIRMTRACLPA
jgi:hypothetical protein